MNVALVYGGYTSEAGVSERSKDGLMTMMDRNTHFIVPVRITESKWTAEPVGEPASDINRDDFSYTNSKGEKVSFDCAYITIHGNPGENGQLGGYFEMIGMPYSTCPSLTSAMTYDKFITNTFLRNLGVNLAKSIMVESTTQYSPAEIVREIGLPCFISATPLGILTLLRRYNVERTEKPSVPSPAITETFEEGSFTPFSKLELTENVRIVTIENVDVCACCAPHVSRTAEIGLIKILGVERRRRGGEGVRVTMLCGLDAYDDYAIKQDNTSEISVMLSAKPNETADAVRRVMTEQEKQRTRISDLSRELAKFRAEAIEETDGNICIFDDVLDEPALREIVNEAVKKCTGIAGVFSGNDEAGYKYIIGSRTVNLREAAGEINKALCGRGGGKSEMIQGSCKIDKKTISNYMSNYIFRQ